MSTSKRTRPKDLTDPQIVELRQYTLHRGQRDVLNCSIVSSSRARKRSALRSSANFE